MTRDITGITADIKSRVSAYNAGLALGLRPDRRGWVCCPLHGESKPSMRLWQDSHGFHCYGCGKGGDVITLVRSGRGGTFWDAVEWLNSAFNLGLTTNQPLPPKAAKSHEIQRKLEATRRETIEAMDAVLYEAYLDAQKLLVELEWQKEDHEPKFDEEWDEEFCEALRLIPEVKDLVERLAVEVFSGKEE